MPPALWQIQEGDTPLVAAAIHDGHAVRDEVAALLALDDAARLREEDPHTGTWARVADTWVIAHRSRFEFDLNRSREKAVYRTPADAWGLDVWKSAPEQPLIARSLACYDDFYATMHHLFRRLERRFGAFVVFDLHSYNHRRGGPDAPPADPQGNPQVNIGTGTMDRTRWATVVDCFIEKLREHTIAGSPLDVRENIKFRGGSFAHWSHTTFPQSACVLSIEFKKFFMDEWTGTPDPAQIAHITEILQATIPTVLDTLPHLKR
jgi:N-formylglutamate amidohydrolase